MLSCHWPVWPTGQRADDSSQETPGLLLAFSWAAPREEAAHKGTQAALLGR